MDMKRSTVALITSLAMNLTMLVACDRDSTPWLWDEDATPISLPLELDLRDHQEARGTTASNGSKTRAQA